MNSGPPNPKRVAAGRRNRMKRKPLSEAGIERLRTMPCSKICPGNIQPGRGLQQESRV